MSRLAAALAEREELDIFLDALTLVLREVLLRQTVGTLTKHEQHLSLLAESWSAQACIAALHEVLFLQQSLQSPVNKRLALEKMLRNMKEVSETDGNGSRHSL